MQARAFHLAPSHAAGDDDDDDNLHTHSAAAALASGCTGASAAAPPTARRRVRALLTNGAAEANLIGPAVVNPHSTPGTRSRRTCASSNARHSRFDGEVGPGHRTASTGLT